MGPNLVFWKPPHRFPLLDPLTKVNVTRTDERTNGRSALNFQNWKLNYHENFKKRHITTSDRSAAKKTNNSRKNTASNTVWILNNVLCRLLNSLSKVELEISTELTAQHQQFLVAYLKNMTTESESVLILIIRPLLCALNVDVRKPSINSIGGIKRYHWRHINNFFTAGVDWFDI